MGEEPLERARRAWRALEGHLYDPATGLYGERVGRFRRRRHFTFLWPFAGAWSALCALASLEGAEIPRSRLDRQLEALERYRPGGGDLGLSSAVLPPLGQGGDRYFDDNAWIALALCRQWRLTRDASTLERARDLAGFLATGWIGEEHVARPGGIRWKEGLGPGSRNTCSNAPVAELAAILHLEGADPSLLELAVRIYAWTRAALRTVHGLYADRIAPDGTVTSSVLSYNQGTMIGAGVLLHQATGDERYLEDATRTALTSVGRYGDGTALQREPPGFVAVYLRNLLFLDTVQPDPSFRALAVSYADHLYGRRGGDGLVRPASGDPAPLLSSAALVEVLALVAGARPWP